MVKVTMYPNYWNYYYYEEGEDVILLVRKIGNIELYRQVMHFDSIDEANAYFEEK